MPRENTRRSQPKGPLTTLSDSALNAETSLPPAPVAAKIKRRGKNQQEQAVPDLPSTSSPPSNELQELRAMLEESRLQITRLTESNASLAATVKDTREATSRPPPSGPFKEPGVPASCINVLC